MANPLGSGDDADDSFRADEHFLQPIDKVIDILRNVVNSTIVLFLWVGICVKASKLGTQF